MKLGSRPTFLFAPPFFPFSRPPPTGESAALPPLLLSGLSCPRNYLTNPSVFIAIPAPEPPLNAQPAIVFRESRTTRSTFFRLRLYLSTLPTYLLLLSVFLPRC